MKEGEDADGDMVFPLDLQEGSGTASKSESQGAMKAAPTPAIGGHKGIYTCWS